ncbi:MAG: nitronate monooxygenase, partial [Pseudomonadota bacterium]
LAMGADGGYAGSAFIATKEANAAAAYKQMIATHAAEDIVYTNLFTGVHGNYLKSSIRNQGLDPENLPESDPSKKNFSGGSAKPKSWKEIWGSGQGIGAIKEIQPTADMIARLKSEYVAARARLAV